MCARAAVAGVRAGMPVADATAALPPSMTPLVEPVDRVRDAEALEALALWTQRFSPTVAVDPPDGLAVDVTGCGPVFGGEARLAQKAVDDLRSLGYAARAAIAPTLGAAWAVARFGRENGAVIKDAALHAALAPLPVEALRLVPRDVEALHEVNVRRIGELMELPRSVLPPRFGSGVLLRLDQALGEAIEPIEPIRPRGPVRLERVFDGPTDKWEALEATVWDLIAGACAQLAEREAGARRLVVTLVRSDLEESKNADGRSIRLAASMSRPSRDRKHLFGLIRPRLEKAELGFGIEAIGVEAVRTGPLPHRQGERWLEGGRLPTAAQQRASAELIDTLIGRLGRGHLRRAEVVESHAPERAGRWVDPTRGTGGVRRARVPEGSRPLILLDRPAPADVVALAPDGPLCHLSWRDGTGNLAACIGPERLSGVWWDGETSERDYFRVQDECGRWLWVYRERNVWFVHGLW